LGYWSHLHFHLVSIWIVGNLFHNSGYERLECSTQVVVRVVHKNDISLRIKCLLITTSLVRK
jgi:hypothetical protein